MIFHCPRCQAGHSVPVSMIPDGGLPLSCRRCDNTFKVDLPPELSDPALHPDDTPEATRIGVVTPFSEIEIQEVETPAGPDAALWLVGGSSLGEAPADETPANNEVTTVDGAPEVTDLVLDASLSEAADMRPRTASDQRPTIPADAEPLPPGPREAGVHPELDETLEVAEDPASTGAQVKAARRPPPLPPSSEPAAGTPEVWAPVERSSNLDTERAEAPETLALDEEGSLYGPVARLRYTPPPQPAKGAPRAWADPSELSQPIVRGPVGWLRTKVNKLDGGPLLVKGAVLFGPLVAGLILLAMSWGRLGEPERSSTRVERAPDVGRAAAPPPPAPPPGPYLQGQGLPDVPANAPEAFVQVDRARMRIAARLKAPVVGRLAAGRAVRVLGQRRKWRLVFVEPDGPVGFVKATVLGSQRPLLALARDRSFEGCGVTSRINRRDCLGDAKSSQAACNLQCSVQSALSVERCKAACQLAFDECASGCRRKRRRR